MMQKQQPFQFLMLPPELRNQIYASFLVGPRPISVYLVGKTLYNDIRHFGLQTALLRTSQQCYQEGLAILYGGNVFKIYSIDMRGWDSTDGHSRRVSNGNTKTSKNPALPAMAMPYITTLTVTSSFLYDSNIRVGVIMPRSSTPNPKSVHQNKTKSKYTERLLSLFPGLRTLHVFYDTAHESDAYAEELLNLIETVPRNVDLDLVMSKSALATANPDIEVWRKIKQRKPNCLLARKYKRWEEDEELAATESRQKWDGLLKMDPYPMLEDIVERN